MGAFERTILLCLLFGVSAASEVVSLRLDTVSADLDKLSATLAVQHPSVSATHGRSASEGEEGEEGDTSSEDAPEEVDEDETGDAVEEEETGDAKDEEALSEAGSFGPCPFEVTWEIAQIHHTKMTALAHISDPSTVSNRPRSCAASRL